MIDYLFIKIINTLYSIPNDRSIGEMPLLCFDTSNSLLVVECTGSLIICCDTSNSLLIVECTGSSLFCFDTSNPLLVVESIEVKLFHHF